MVVDYGTDLDCATDLTRTLSLASGQRNLGNALVRRLSTPTGALAYAPTYGIDLRAALSGPMTSGYLSSLQSAIEQQCEADERVARASASVQYNYATQALTVDLVIDPDEGPTFALVIAVDKLTVSMLEAA